MVKRLYVFIIALCGICSLTISAETISQKQALTIATQFFNHVNRRVVPSPKLVFTARNLTTDRLFIPLYIYNSPIGGFVIIPSDNKALPILAYSFTDSFNQDNIPQSTLNLLKLYANHIERIRYDSTIPYEAIAAWNDIPTFIAKVVDSPYVADDMRIPYEDALLLQKESEDMDELDLVTSDIYTPSQWADNIESDITNGIQPILSISNTPYIVTGYRDQYFRLQTDIPNRSLWRLMPTEILNNGEFLLSSSIKPLQPVETPDEEPFTFYNSYYPFAKEALTATIQSPEMVKSKVEQNGSGHFTVNSLRNAVKLDVYSQYGSHIQSKKFNSGTQMPAIDISSFPQGIYIAMITYDDGLTESFKLIR